MISSAKNKSRLSVSLSLLLILQCSFAVAQAKNSELTNLNVTSSPEASQKDDRGGNKKDYAAKPIDTAIEGLDFKISEGKAEQSNNSSPDQTPDQNPEQKPDSGEKPINNKANNQVKTSATQLSKNATEAEDLTLEETQDLLRQLPELSKADLREHFILPSSMPKPNSQHRIAETFPPKFKLAPVAQPTVNKLEVQSVRPNGSVQEAMNVSITFSQPMVPVSSQTIVKAKELPVSMKPKVEGEWKWYGTQTLTFEPKDTRLPMATTYEITIPEGARSTLGARLEAKASYKFTTSPARLIASYPARVPAVRPTTLMMAQFNQKVDKKAILAVTKISASNRKLRPDLATKEEIAQDKELTKLLKAIPAETVVVFKANEELPSNSHVRVIIGPNIPSAEGQVSDGIAVDNFSFRTYGPFEIAPQIPNEFSLSPESPITLRFTNPIDVKSVSKARIKIIPEIDDYQIQSYGDVIYITGYKKPNTAYHVQLTREIIDSFGQSLSGNLGRDISVTHAQKQLFMPMGLSVVSTKEKPKFIFSSTNLDSVELKIYKVEPEDYQHYISNEAEFLQSIHSVFAGNYKIKNKSDQAVSTEIDLNQWLDNRRGSLIVSVRSRDLPYARDVIRNCWVQCTNLGLDAFYDAQTIETWVTDLESGRPIKDAKVLCLPDKSLGKSDEHGLSCIHSTQGSPIIEPLVVIASLGKDKALVGERYPWTRRQSDKSRLLWCVMTDRSPYKPNETVFVKGIVRSRLSKPDAELSVPNEINGISFSFEDSLGNSIVKGQAEINRAGAFDFSFKLPERVNLGYAQLKLTALVAKEKGKSNYHSSLDYQTTIQVDEFRRPEFELTLKNEGDPTHLIHSSTTISAATKYFSGGVLPHAQIKWQAQASPAPYQPPGWSQFTFGRAQPFFCFRGYIPRPVKTPPPQILEGITDPDGKHSVRLDLLGVNPPEPSTVTVSATVQDLNRQAWTNTTNILVHPSKTYVGIKLEKTYVKKGETLSASLIATDIDGKLAVERPIKVKIWRLGNSEQEERQEEERQKDDLQTFSITSSDKSIKLDLQPKLAGLYKIEIKTKDKDGLPNLTESQFWVQGGDVAATAAIDNVFRVKKLLLLPEKTEYKPGETASLLIESPFYPANGIATIWHDGLAQTIPFSMNSASYKLEIPITEKLAPLIGVQVDVLGAENNNESEKNGKRDKHSKQSDSLPAEATATVNLKVSPEFAKLLVTAKAIPDECEPGKEISVKLHVQDSAGKDTKNAELTLAVVDEALLSLANYHFPNPLDAFYTSSVSPDILRERPNLQILTSLLDLKKNQTKSETHIDERPMVNGGAFANTMTYHRASLQSMDASDGAAQSSALASGPARKRYSPVAAQLDKALEPVGNQPSSSPGDGIDSIIRSRSNFEALVKWVPAAMTDDQGNASIKLTMPDSVSKFRIMVFASHSNNQFGTCESSLATSLPLTIKPSPPRFLNFGDRFELPIVIQNQTDERLTVRLAVRGNNILFSRGQGRKIIVEAHDRAEVRIPARTLKTGLAQFQTIAVAANFSDSAQFSLPVYSPSTTEDFATYGQIDSGSIGQSVETPDDALPDFGSLELTTSSTILETVTDAFLYLQHYPFECSEQIASRLLSTALLQDMLKAFHVPSLPSDSEIEKSRGADLAKLQSRQQKDGSFSLWSNGQEKTYPYVSLHVIHALLLSKAAGYNVPQSVLDRSLKYLRSLDRYIIDYKPNARLNIKSFAFYLQNLAQDIDISKARKMFYEQPLDKMPLESLAFLLHVFSVHGNCAQESKAIHSYMKNMIIESASTAELVPNKYAINDFSDYSLFDSPMRTNAIFADALIKEGHSKEIVPKLMRSILGGQSRGRWRNTQENVYVLLAMRHYFDTYEKEEPNFSAKAWLGKDFLGESSFTGRSNDFKTITVPMSFLAAHASPQDFVLSKTGGGRLYYRLGMNYSPKSLKLNALQRGFSVERSYEGATTSGDAVKDNLGIWHFKSGSLIRVKLTLNVPASRFFVALVDPIPAGAEILNENLNGSEHPTPVSPSVHLGSSDDRRIGRIWWMPNWWNHQNKRDNQAEVFADRLGPSTKQYEYLIRATTPGTFVVPPCKAEEMYAPETFGRTQSELVVID